VLVTIRQSCAKTSAHTRKHGKNCRYGRPHVPKSQPTAKGGDDEPPRSPARSLGPLEGVQSLRRMTYDALHQAIVSGELKPGEWLRQDAIAESLGVSRLPVKAALIQLEAEGLVAFKPRRGAVVRSMTLEQAEELFDMRQVLEPLALRRSIRRLDDDRIERLRTLGRQLDEAADPDSFAKASTAFYRELYDAEHNPLLVELIEELRSRLSRYLVGWDFLQGHRGGHTELVGHVVRKDFRAAKSALLSHLRSVPDGYEQMLATRD
jgi:DNA-binding GntR family transcriptional regulator